MIGVMVCREQSAVILIYENFPVNSIYFIQCQKRRCLFKNTWAPLP